MTSGWRAASATQDITPRESFPLGGYSARTEKARGTRDALEANVLILASDETRVVWITLDVLAIMPALRQAITLALSEQCGLSPDEVIIVASHTHSAPAAWTGAIHPVLPADLDTADLARIATLLAGTAARLMETRLLTPVKVSYGRGIVAGAGTNRHDPDGPHDSSIGTLCVADQNGPLAVMFDYACHPTVLGAANLLYSSDWVGAARVAIRNRLQQPGLSILHLPGPQGDISTRFTRRSYAADETTRIGSIVGDAVIDALKKGSTDSDSTLSLSHATIDAPTRTSFAEFGLMLESENSIEERLKSSLTDARSAIAAYESADVPRILAIPLTEVRVGPRRYLHTPFEMGTTLARRVVELRPNTRLIGYTDAYDSYLVDRESHHAGHYEAAMSFFDADETDQIVDQIVGFAARVS